jgi:hypothetical protein
MVGGVPTTHQPCPRRCLETRPERTLKLTAAWAKTTKEQKTVSIVTMIAIGIGMSADQCDDAARTRFPYYLPYIGGVCQVCFMDALNISKDKLSRLRNQAMVDLTPPCHANVGNNNAACINTTLIIEWFRSLAAEIGEAVPVMTRRKKKQHPLAGDAVTVTYTKADATLLPSYWTWASLHDEYKLWAAAMYSAISIVYFMKILKDACPLIRICSPPSNVCDECVGFSNITDKNSVDHEVIRQHVDHARSMRLEYLEDLATCSEEKIVIVLDYSQNLTVPHNPQTPSQWYFLSLISVSLFGIFFGNEKKYYNYVYSERVGVREATR